MGGLVMEKISEHGNAVVFLGFNEKGLAKFGDGMGKFLLNQDNLEIRIHNLKEQEIPYSVEETVLELMKVQKALES